MNLVKLVKNIVDQDYLFSIISRVFGIGIAMVYSVFFNRYLGIELKGDAAIISNYIGLISPFVCLGMYQAYPYYKKKNGDEFYPFVNNMTSLYSILLVLISGVALILALLNNFMVACVLIPIQAYVRHINYVVMIENPKRRSFSSMLINLAELFVIVGFFFFTEANYHNMIAILVIQNVIILIISYQNLKVDIKQLKFTLSKVFKYAKFGIVPMFTLILMTINYRIDVMMLDYFDNVTKADIGIYSVGVALAEKMWLLPDAMKDILLSRLSKNGDNNEVAKTIRIGLAVTFLMVIFVAAFGKAFVYILYGEDFVGAEIITLIMAIGILGMIFYKMVYSYNIANGNRISSLVFLGVAAVINLVGNYLSIPYGGIYAAAFCSVVSYTVCGLCFLIYFRKKTNISVMNMLFIRKNDIKGMIRFFKR